MIARFPANLMLSPPRTLTRYRMRRTTTIAALTMASGSKPQMYIATTPLTKATARKTLGTDISADSINVAPAAPTTMNRAFTMLLAATVRARCAASLRACRMV